MERVASGVDWTQHLIGAADDLYGLIPGVQGASQTVMVSVVIDRERDQICLTVHNHSALVAERTITAPGGTLAVSPLICLVGIPGGFKSFGFKKGPNAGLPVRDLQTIATKLIDAQ